MDLFLFDFDKTLYACDFRMRPSTLFVTGASHLTKTWWAGALDDAITPFSGRNS